MVKPTITLDRTRRSASREQWRNGNIVEAIIMSKWQLYMDQQVTWLNQFVTNGLSHPYNLDKSIFILGASGVIFQFIPHFDENRVSKQNSPRWNAAFCY